jgi:hypothetical protein
MSKTAAVGNGFDPDVVQRFVREIEKHQDTLASYKGEYMNRCKSVHELITRAKDAAKKAGIPKKQLGALLKERELERKIEDIREAFEDEEDVEIYDRLREALGDFGETELGKSAINKAKGATKGGGANDDGEDDVRPGFLKQQEAERVKQNKKLLKENIKGMPSADPTKAH